MICSAYTFVQYVHACFAGMFRKISLYTELFQNRMEALLSDEAVDEEKKTFDAAVRILTLKDYDYLDFRNTQYDKDYADFQARRKSF